LVTPSRVVAAALVSVAAYRVLTMAASGEPAGLDFGNWLMLGWQTLGQPLEEAASVSYPPIVPLLSVAFTSTFGVVWGTALLAGLASVVPALGFYVGCRLLRIGWPSVPPALLIAAASSSGEAAAWGGVPQLLGLGIASAAFGAAQVSIEGRSVRHAMLLSAALLGLGATSHLIFAQAILALALLLLVNAVANPGWFRRGTWLGKDGWLALAAICMLPLTALLPLYARLTATVGQSFATGTRDSADSGLVSFARALVVVYRDAPWAWRLAIVATMATPLMLLIRRTEVRGVWTVTIGIALSLWLQAVVAGHGRLVFLMPTAVGFCLAAGLSWWASTHPTGFRPLAPSLVAAFVLVASARGLALFPTQQQFYGSIQPPGTVAALDWLRDETPSDALVAVAPVNGAPFGWWVQGYGRRAAMVGSDDRWLNIPEERDRAFEVVALLSSPNPLDQAVLDRAAELGLDYLVLPWAWGGLDPEELTEFRSGRADLVEFSNSAMVIIRVP
jgi:hypothetical protein